MASEARPAFLAITGRRESETLVALVRFVAAIRDATGLDESHANLAACSVLAGQAFGGDETKWAPLVAAVHALLAVRSSAGARAVRSRRELRAFVAENSDLLDDA